MVRDDIAMLLYQSGFGNEILTVDTKCKAVQCIMFNQVFKTRRDQISDLMEGLSSLGILELLRANEACRALLFPRCRYQNMMFSHCSSIRQTFQTRKSKENSGSLNMSNYLEEVALYAIVIHSFLCFCTPG